MRSISGAAAFLVFVTSCSRGPEAYLDKGNRNYAAGKYDEARLNYKAAIQKNSALGPAYYRLGMVEMQLAEPLEAYNAFTRAVELMPRDLDAKSRLAEVALDAYMVNPQRPRNLYGVLTTLAGQFLGLDPDSFEGLRIKGVLALTEKKTPEAIDFFERANRSKPLQPGLVLLLVQALLQSGDSSRAEDLALRTIEADKAFGPLYDILYGHYMSAGRKTDAEQLLQRRVAANPKDSAAFVQLAAHYARLGMNAESEAALRRVTDHPSDFPGGSLAVGDYYRSTGRIADATLQYRSGLARISGDKTLYQFRLAESLAQQGGRDESIGLLNSILSVHPEDERTVAARAGLLLERGSPDDLKAAVEGYKWLARRRPGDAEQPFNLGRCYLAQKATDAARRAFEDAARIRADYIEPRLILARLAEQARQFPDMLRYANEALSIQPGLAAARFLRAEALAANQQYDAARIELNRLLGESPPDAALQLAALDLAQKRYQSAEARFRQVAQAHPGDARALQGLSEAYLADHQAEQSLSVWTSELKRSESPQAREGLALAATRAGKEAIAIEQYNRLLDGNPQSAALHSRLGEALWLNGDSGKALTEFAAAKALDPSAEYPASFEAYLEQSAGRLGEAEKNYRAILAGEPENAMVLNNLAFLLAEKGSVDEAQRLAERAHLKQPGNADYSDTLAWIYLKQSQTQAALQILRNVVQKYPSNPVFRYHLGAALLKKGDRQKAREELQATLAMKPSQQEEREVRTLLGQLN